MIVLCSVLSFLIEGLNIGLRVQFMQGLTVNVRYIVSLIVGVIGKTLTISRAINAVGVDVRGKVMFKVIALSISTSISIAI